MYASFHTKNKISIMGIIIWGEFNHFYFRFFFFFSRTDLYILSIFFYFILRYIPSQNNKNLILPEMLWIILLHVNKRITDCFYSVMHKVIFLFYFVYQDAVTILDSFSEQ